MSVHNTRHFACLVLLATSLAACGGDDSTFTEASVSSAITELVRNNLAGQDITIDPLQCVKDGDQYHWRCLTTALEGESTRYRMSLQVTCDRDSGQCLSEPAVVAPLP